MTVETMLEEVEEKEKKGKTIETYLLDSTTIELMAEAEDGEVESRKDCDGLGRRGATGRR